MKNRKWIVGGLIAALCITVAVFFGVWTKQEKTEEITVTYRLLLENLDTTYMAPESLMAVGDQVTNHNGTAVLGEVQAISFLPHQTVTVQQETLVMAPVPNRIDCYVTVISQGSYRPGDGIRICDIRIAAGGNYGVHVGALFVPSASLIHVEVVA